MIRAVADPRVWSSVRWLYMGSGLLFLANISLGILNATAPADIERGQILAHFHAGTIGWVTLSVIATTIWVYTGQRKVSPGYARFVSVLTVVAVLSVGGYIAAFGLAFNGDGPFWMLPLFGVPTWAVVLSGMAFAWSQLKHQAVITTVHLLLFGALIVASIGATMGVIWGLTYSTGSYLGPAAAEGIGAHAAPMDMYLALAFAGLIELLIRRDDAKRWTKPGLTQMILGVAGGLLAAAALYTGVERLIPVALLAFLLTFAFYMVRIGWRTFTVNPFGPGRRAAIFWGGLAFPVYIILFVVLVQLYFIPGELVPHDLEIVFVHVTFIGAGTNLLLATQSAYSEGSPLLRRMEPVALWILNLGMLAFFATEYFADRTDGAYLMALGVLSSLLLVWARLGRSWEPPGGQDPLMGRQPESSGEGQTATAPPSGTP